MPTDDHWRHAVIGAVFVALHPDGAAIEAAGEIVQQIKRAREHMGGGERGEFRHAEHMPNPLQSRRRAGCEALATASIAGVDQHDAAVFHIVVQRLRPGGIRRGIVGTDGPIEQRIEAKFIAAGMHRVGRGEGRVGAAVHVIRQPEQPRPRHRIACRIGADIGQPRRQSRAVGRSLRVGGQAEHQQHRHTRSPQQSTQGQRDQQIDGEQRQRRCHRPGRQIGITAHACQALHIRALHHRGGDETIHARPQIMRPPCCALAVKAGRMAGGSQAGEVGGSQRQGRR